MEIKTAQHDVQTTFLRGAVGQTVSGLIWLASAAIGTWGTERQAILVLVLGGMFIFPLTQLGLRLLGRPAGLPAGHPMNALAMQVAFMLPLNMLLVGAAALYNINWFYPAFMLIVGTHYLPFIFLYGMWEFGVLAALLIFGGVGIAMLFPDSFTLGGWVTAILLLLFAVFVQFSSRIPRQ
ncbi:MAG TPA: hypothetical protein VHO49_08650 [Anaerolineales bacterium]|nr:hypothetical protein [Anaerolineales bacterium]